MNCFQIVSLIDKDFWLSAYFVTIVTKNRECLFGNIVVNEMILNDAGNIVQQWYLDIPNHFPNVKLDAFIIMPNHVHGIIFITENHGKRIYFTINATILKKKSI